MISSSSYDAPPILSTKCEPPKIADSVHLHELLPSIQSAKKISEWPELLQRYSCISKLAQEAFDKFLRRQMSFFDPLVGEHACQIRAAMLAEMCHDRDLNHHLLKSRDELTLLAEKIQVLLVRLHERQVTADSFESLLKESGLRFVLSGPLSVIFFAYVLTKGKSVDYVLDEDGLLKRRERMVPEKLSGESRLSNKFFKQMVLDFQRKLSESSEEYVHRIAQRRLTSLEEWACTRFVSGDYVKTDKLGKKVLPCYPAMQLILSEMLRLNKETILQIELCDGDKPYGFASIVFGTYISECGALPTRRRLEEGTLFFRARSRTKTRIESRTLENRIFKLGVENLILSSAADHPQYGSDDSCRPENPDCERARLLAHKWGVSRDNPFLFTLEHIFCGVAEDYLNAVTTVEELSIKKDKPVSYLFFKILRLTHCPYSYLLNITCEGRRLKDNSATIDELGLKTGSILEVQSSMIEDRSLISKRKFKLIINEATLPKPSRPEPKDVDVLYFHPDEY